MAMDQLIAIPVGEFRLDQRVSEPAAARPPLAGAPHLGRRAAGLDSSQAMRGSPLRTDGAASLHQRVMPSAKQQPHSRSSTPTRSYDKQLGT